MSSSVKELFFTNSIKIKLLPASFSPGIALLKPAYGVLEYWTLEHLFVNRDSPPEGQIIQNLKNSC